MLKKASDIFQQEVDMDYVNLVVNDFMQQPVSRLLYSADSGNPSFNYDFCESFVDDDNSSFMKCMNNYVDGLVTINEVDTEDVLRLAFLARYAESRRSENKTTDRFMSLTVSDFLKYMDTVQGWANEVGWLSVKRLSKTVHTTESYFDPEKITIGKLLQIAEHILNTSPESITLFRSNTLQCKNEHSDAASVIMLLLAFSSAIYYHMIIGDPITQEDDDIDDDEILKQMYDEI